MPEEREQRIHYVRLSLFTQVIGRRDSGTLGGGGCACSLVAGEPEKCRCSCFVFRFEEQGSCLHVCFLWHTTWCPGLAAYALSHVTVRSFPPKAAR